MHQPWASLIALGAKTIETRGWATKYRGPLAVHAAVREPEQALRLGDYVVGWEYQAPSHPILFDQPVGEPWPQLPENGGCDRTRCVTHDLPLGAVVATCELVDCVPTAALRWGSWTFPDAPWWRPDPDYHLDLIAVRRDQVPYGDFTRGRFAWLLADIKPLDPPVPAKGKQGLWEWSGDVA